MSSIRAMHFSFQSFMKSWLINNWERLPGSSEVSWLRLESSIPERDNEMMYTSRPSSPARLWMMLVFPDPGAPCWTYQSEMDRMAGRKDETNKKVTSAERNAAGCVPWFTFQEIFGVVEQEVFDAGFQDDGAEGAFWAAGHLPPVTVAEEESMVEE